MDASLVSQVQRKIELQLPSDLSYLVTNVRRAADTLIGEAFPQHGEDDLRSQIETLVNEFIETTFALAAPNLTVNGLTVSWAEFTSSAREAYEPFDSRKRQRVADLIAKEEKLLEEVAALKRTVPGRAAEVRVKQLEGVMETDQEEMDSAVKRVVEGVEGERLRVRALERQDGVEAGFQGAVETLARLKRDMPAVVAKMERARVAGEYVRDAE